MHPKGEKLLQFHITHFPGQPLPPISHPILGFSSTTALQELENLGQVGDALGYYEDGVKRTLTDEQIAIFRHTEIQELLRTRARRAELSPETTSAGNEKATKADEIVCVAGVVQNGETELELMEQDVELYVGEAALRKTPKLGTTIRMTQNSRLGDTSLDYGNETSSAGAQAESALKARMFSRARNALTSEAPFQPNPAAKWLDNNDEKDATNASVTRWN